MELSCPEQDKRYWETVLYNLSVAVIVADSTHDDYCKEFSDHQMALLAFSLCDEECFAGGVVERTMSYLQGNQWDSGRGDPVESSYDCQPFQCARATKYLLQDNLRSPLTSNLIREAHQILMTKTLHEGGTYRTVRADNEGHVFLPPTTIHRSMESIIDRYNRSNLYPIEKATHLLFDLFHIRPFVRGNGRLCRLIFAWSVMRDGFPFPLDISGGKHPEKYEHAMTQYASQLNVVALAAMKVVMGNYIWNLRHVQATNVNKGT